MYWDAADQAMLRPFAWGEADCATAAAAAFKALHGVDVLAPVRGRWRSLPGALALLRREGGWPGLSQRLAAAAGLVEVPLDTPGALGVSVPGAPHAPTGQALLFAPEAGLWIGKSAAGYVAGVPCAQAWAPCRS